jgi:hypothetical protein
LVAIGDCSPRSAPAKALHQAQGAALFDRHRPHLSTGIHKMPKPIPQAVSLAFSQADL